MRENLVASAVMSGDGNEERSTRAPQTEFRSLTSSGSHNPPPAEMKAERRYNISVERRGPMF